jgi:hypothetical protein
MNRADVSKLLNLVRALSPSFTIKPSSPDELGTGDAWFELLADIPADAAYAAVKAHFAVGGPWIAVSDIRRHVAGRYGALPPDPDVALAQARHWSAWRGPAHQPWPADGEPELHPAVREAARTLGWNWLDDTDDRYARPRWRETYTAAAERHTQRALAPGGIAAIRAEIAAGSQRPAIEAAPVEGLPVAADSQRLAELRQQIARTATRKAIPAAKPVYDPPSDEEKRRWASALSDYIQKNNLGDIDIKGEAE